MQGCGYEVIVEVGAEGGSVTLYGIRSRGEWVFSRHTIDQFAEAVDKPLKPMDSHTTTSWSEALALLDSYPWHRLFPLQVHPEFRGVVFDAVKVRYGDAEDSVWNRLSDWKTLCGILDD